jgi:hypothetical protein
MKVSEIEQGCIFTGADKSVFEVVTIENDTVTMVPFAYYRTPGNKTIFRMPLKKFARWAEQDITEPEAA